LLLPDSRNGYGKHLLSDMKVTMRLGIGEPGGVAQEAGLRPYEKPERGNALTAHLIAIGEVDRCSAALAALVGAIDPTPLDTLDLPTCPYHQPYRFTQ
jgi:hypothetical protein